MKPTIADLRRDYTRDGLTESQAPNEPYTLFSTWFAQAVEIESTEANAMMLASVDAQGQPHLRTLLLKGFDERGFVFFTNYQSAKGEQLAAQPLAAMTFWWHDLERQVRIEGQIERVSSEESDVYFHSRPAGSRLGAWASPQSQVIAGREVLEDRLQALEVQYAEEQPPRPPHWGGYRLVPSLIEFWQGRSSRLHDRLRYRLESGQWVRERLAP
ncbi:MULTISPECIES: pyridoxamine 5'-phosphate oxidase [Pseudomonas]|uniref:Pyridoxine/pyridoxamine 5'-phosphate oxidase n=1 Tax=Pseudomonas neustonica TaxID=2487346 RepID=A0ABX9XNS8_9PSED|nr:MULTISPECIES: pyridoxamine 5'-phosphate oxidase [Pseudomonas]MBA6418533.1 pyridoxamine 5'-phosphate oxidase [Pseudomonas sp. 5Ae-yellow]ROZ84983.1 pyridoxamine 5'-phosphate oxidase [Pseudomonas sp. SSM44]ROZ86730.1 pyridoxamine 5'-phosphate oxidase [Pseudomonas neustonica]|tara:strand:+ start:19690 stop:20331 length:642 start_codon:yes stop_codon:yes gene_type:complete